MANKPEEKRRRRVRTLIQDSKKIINNFDRKEIKPKHYVIVGLMNDVLYEMEFIEKWIDFYELFMEENKKVLNEQEIDYSNIIIERENDLKDLRECFSGLYRIYQHVGLDHR